MNGISKRLFCKSCEELFSLPIVKYAQTYFLLPFGKYFELSKLYKATGYPTYADLTILFEYGETFTPQHCDSRPGECMNADPHSWPKLVEDDG